MELLLQSLKNELESTESTETVVIPKEKYVMPTKYEDYDEIFEDEL
jgi:hypothetical protein